MAKLAIAPFIVLLLASFPAFAAQVQTFIDSSFEPDQVVSAQELSGADYVLILADGQETYVVHSSTAQPILEAHLIEQALKEHVKSQTGVQALADSAAALPAKILEAKQEYEKDCMRLTGTDMHDCTSKETCILACKANPNCDILLYAEGFWEEILGWTTQRKNFSQLVLSYQENIDKVTYDESVADEKIDKLSGLLQVSQNITQSGLFLNRSDEGCIGLNATRRCYAYCPKVDYSSLLIEQEKSNMLSIKSIHSQLAQQKSRSLQILERTNENEQHLSTRETRFAELRLYMLNEMIRLEKSLSNLSNKVKDLSIETSIQELANLSEEIIELGEDGYYRQSLEKGNEFKAKANYTAKKIESALYQYQQMQGAIASLEDKLDKASYLLDDPAQQEFSSNLSQIKSNASAVQTMSQISQAMSDIGAIESELMVAVTDAALAKDLEADFNPKLPPVKGIPKDFVCLPAAAILLALVFVFPQPRKS